MAKTKSPGKKSRGTIQRVRKKPKSQGYRLYILRLLKKIRPGVNISNTAMNTLNDMTKTLISRLNYEAAVLTDARRIATIREKDVLAAAKLLMKGDLLAHSIMECRKATANYDQGPVVEKGGKKKRKKK
ncbi:unnamed protein product [Bursaphelenchus okinawaensis]|uniref:Core Histone H2A/H2B/H3 domain-containing protein n=1 Tax=Bursaphelenchus okinawaensis TaxID=465554 RepID=A0A811KCW4_9BILA|nr:unnamed protein product [Bursaphelenchus okinawaensis]CAG9101177.1 unnamed protein product [Bursaphelenchus okinawaensis]